MIDRLTEGQFESPLASLGIEQVEPVFSGVAKPLNTALLGTTRLPTRQTGVINLTVLRSPRSTQGAGLHLHGN